MTLPQFDLTGRAAVVTGGNGGIGLGFARALARAGSDVAVWGRDAAKNEAAGAELDGLGAGRVLVQAVDVSDLAAVDDAFGETVDAFGDLHACFANAGVSTPPTRFVDQDPAEWDRVLQTNLHGAVQTLRVAARHMLDRGIAGSLVGVASLAAVQGQARQQPYAAAKAGLVATVNALAVELGRKGIRANSVLPGFVRTDMTPMLDEPALEGRVLTRIPAGRWGSPDDFGGIAVYLASDASSYHSGQSFLIDGGYFLF